MNPLRIGQTASRRRVFTDADVAAYRELTGDRRLCFGPTGDAANTVPGPLLGGLISDLLGTDLPGNGTNWLKQQISYNEAALTSQELTATVTVSGLRPEKGLVNLTIVINGVHDKIICKGESLVLVRDLRDGTGDTSPKG